MLLGLTGLVTLALAAAPLASVSADFGGDGRIERASVVQSDSAMSLELRDSEGRVLAQESFPSPPPPGKVRLTTGPLGSAGALLEVAASSPGAQCRSVWRFREGKLSRLPVEDGTGPIADCPDTEWSYRWQRPDPKAPASYVRERSRRLAGGVHRQMEVFRFTGFALTLDPALSRSQIRGIEIPRWTDTLLYPKTNLEALYARFDLSQLKSCARLRIVTNRSEGIFELERRKTGFSPRSFPIRSLQPGAEPGETLLSAKGEARLVRARVTVGGGGAIPVEAVVTGAGHGDDGFYRAVIGGRDPGLEVFPSAEDELAVKAVAGEWSDESGGRKSIPLLSAFPARLRFGPTEVSLSIERAPEGLDLLLLPVDGSAPTAGLVLLGPDRIASVAVQCDSAEGAANCRGSGARVALRRVGSRLNSP